MTFQNILLIVAFAVCTIIGLGFGVNGLVGIIKIQNGQGTNEQTQNKQEEFYTNIFLGFGAAIVFFVLGILVVFKVNENAAAVAVIMRIFFILFGVAICVLFVCQGLSCIAASHMKFNPIPECIECGETVSTEDAYCRHCGAEIEISDQNDVLENK